MLLRVVLRIGSGTQVLPAVDGGTHFSSTSSAYAWLVFILKDLKFA